MNTLSVIAQDLAACNPRADVPCGVSVRRVCRPGRSMRTMMDRSYHVFCCSGVRLCDYLTASDVASIRTLLSLSLYLALALSLSWPAMASL